MGIQSETEKMTRAEEDAAVSPAESDSERRPADGERIYCMQKHRASTLHYDLRLQIGGALASWAVPKGPSTNPADKRLAIRVDDHPLDYADFEGVIPEDSYGAGTVMVWDRGTHENLKDRSLEEALADGHIEVFIRGEKLQGGYALVQMQGRGEDNWLLIKMDDDHARRDINITEAAPHSAASGRSLEEIAAESAE